MIDNNSSLVVSKNLFCPSPVTQLQTTANRSTTLILYRYIPLANIQYLLLAHVAWSTRLNLGVALRVRRVLSLELFELFVSVIEE